jgi:hypothetical protein
MGLHGFPRKPALKTLRFAAVWYLGRFLPLPHNLHLLYLRVTVSSGIPSNPVRARDYSIFPLGEFS